MTSSGIGIYRLVNQQIAESNLKKLRQVSRRGDMQAQEDAMAKWAIGVRLPDGGDWGHLKVIRSNCITRSLTGRSISQLLDLKFLSFIRMEPQPQRLEQCYN